jgi:heme A synthase
MVWIGIGALVVLSTIFLVALVQINQAGQQDATRPQCSPSRYVLTDDKLYRWRELEKSLNVREGVKHE